MIFSFVKFFYLFFFSYQLRWMFFLSFLLAQKIQKRAPLADIQPTQGYSQTDSCSLVTSTFINRSSFHYRKDVAQSLVA